MIARAENTYHILSSECLVEALCEKAQKSVSESEERNEEKKKFATFFMVEI